jgi:hypothetical protein
MLNFQRPLRFYGDTRRATFSGLYHVSRVVRYSLIDIYDRSFDLQYQIANERRAVSPAITLGLRDYLGTGRYSDTWSTKTLGECTRGDRWFRVWGRLGSLNGLLFLVLSTTRLKPDRRQHCDWHRPCGPIFPWGRRIFGGVEWRINDGWTALAE